MRTDHQAAQATAETAVEMPDWYTAFNLPWAWDAASTLARIRWLVLPPGVEEGTPEDCATKPDQPVALLDEYAATDPGTILRPEVSQVQYF